MTINLKIKMRIDISIILLEKKCMYIFPKQFFFSLSLELIVDREKVGGNGKGNRKIRTFNV